MRPTGHTIDGSEPYTPLPEGAVNRLAWLALFVFITPARAADEWVPAQTYAVIAGVLQWQNKGLGGFPTEHRKDRELRDVLLTRGVPADQIALLLDEQAT